MVHPVETGLEHHMSFTDMLHRTSSNMPYAHIVAILFLRIFAIIFLRIFVILFLRIYG